MIFSKAVSSYGNTLAEVGSVKRNWTIKNSAILVANGTDNSLSFSDLSGITIVDYEGTTTPAISTNDITLTAGTLSYLELSSGSKYYISEANGAIIYDSVNGLHGTINGTLTGVWDVSDDARPDSFIDGYEKYLQDADGETVIQVPYGLSPTIA